MKIVAIGDSITEGYPFSNQEVLGRTFSPRSEVRSYSSMKSIRILRVML